MAKDKTYWLGKLQADVQGRIDDVKFRTWDPLTTWLEAIGKRLAEASADLVQKGNDFFVDSAKGTAAGEPLRRRLEGNEGVYLVEAVGADDGTITLGRNTPPASAATFPAGTIKVSPPVDPASPASPRPVFVNVNALTIDTDETSWTVAFKADDDDISVGTMTNLQAGTILQLVTQATLLDTAEVATAFTTGRDTETESAYKRRGKLEMVSRAKATEDALTLAAITAGAKFVHIVESFEPEETPVTIYAAGPDGTLSSGLRADILTRINGNGLPVGDPDRIPAVRAKGIFVDVQEGSALTVNFTIPLTTAAWVVDTTDAPKLTTLRADIASAIEAYVDSLNEISSGARILRINTVKRIVTNFQQRGVVDVDDDDFLPAANINLSVGQVVAMGVITWP